MKMVMRDKIYPSCDITYRVTIAVVMMYVVIGAMIS
jgi:hypothetical protein